MIMQYDVKRCCLEYLRFHRERADRLAAEVCTDADEAKAALEAERAREVPVLAEMKVLAPKVEKFRNVRRVTDEVKGLRARWRELRHEASVLRREIRKRARVLREAARVVAMYEGISHEIGGGIGLCGADVDSRLLCGA